MGPRAKKILHGRHPSLGRAVLHASTLGEPDREALAQRFAAASEADTITLGGREHVLRVTPVGDDAVVVLQRPLAEALAPWDRLLLVLLAIAAAGALLALVGAALVAGRVSRPVRDLARAARRVAAGDFAAAVSIRQRDELGELGEKKRFDAHRATSTIG